MTRRILVLGATSLIGRRLLAAPPSDAELIALSRSPSAHVSGATWIVADLAEPDVANRLPAVDAVLALCPIWLLPPVLPALLATGARRLVAVSSTSRLTKVGSPVAAEREVARRLAEGEDAVQAACDAADVVWTVLRPTLIYAEGEDANVSRLAALIARFGVLPLSGRGAGLRQPAHAADVGQAVLQALDAPSTASRIYAMPGGETLTYREMAARIFEALGRRPRLLSVPPPLWRLGLALASPWLPGATAAMGGRMAEDLVFDAGPAERDFGYAPRLFRPVFQTPRPPTRGVATVQDDDSRRIRGAPTLRRQLKSRRIWRRLVRLTGRDGGVPCRSRGEPAGRLREMDVSRLFGRFAAATAKATGSPWAFILCIVIVLIWAISGPVFHYSDTWQLVINTGTTIITFLMVFLIQNTQNRDGSAIQAKLDDLILTSEADDEFIGIERLTDKELDALHKRCADAAAASHAILERVDDLNKKRKSKSGSPSASRSAFADGAPPKA